MARGQSGGSNNLVVPEAGRALDRMKVEIAAELGLPIGRNAFGNDAEFAAELGTAHAASGREDYWGRLATRDAGAVGGHITKRLVEQAQRSLS